VQNTRAAVNCVAPQGGALIQLVGQGEGSDPRLAAQRYAEEQGVSFTESATARIQGLPAYRASALVTAQQAPLGLDLTWIAHRGLIFRIQSAAPQSTFPRYSEIFRRTASTFGPLTREERASIQERRLHIVTARDRESVAQLSARTGNVWSPEETAVMNGLSEGALLRRGQPIKIALGRPYRP
jgi:predicted Zn-dependent protease